MPSSPCAGDNTALGNMELEHNHGAMRRPGASLAVDGPAAPGMALHTGGGNSEVKVAAVLAGGTGGPIRYSVSLTLT